MIGDDSLFINMMEWFYETVDIEEEYLLLNTITQFMENKSEEFQNYIYDNFYLVDVFLWKL